MKVAFHTLGCKVNQYETEELLEQFKSAGYEIVSENDISDIYIINTCTVTSIADRKSRQYIRRMKKNSPNSLICVIGCYSQVASEELIKMPEVNIVLGNGEKNKLLEYINEYSGEKFSHILPYDELNEYVSNSIICSMEGKSRAYIKIEEGCNRFCSYCLIPYARGMVRSRDPKEVILEAKTLIEKGFKELVLTGINTALYGTESGFNEKYSIDMDGLEYIISEINKLPGIFRIRLSSLEPTVVNKDFVKRLLKYDKLCHHLHLSIQSGSNNVIKLMNRKYTRDDYLEIVKVLREFDKYYGITTDIIVGFSGESEEDFMDSLDIVKKSNFLKVHTFKYSKRKGTKGYLMPNDISPEVKNRRSDVLIETSDKVSISFLQEQIGTVRTVLFEGGENEIFGYTDSYIKVYAKSTNVEDLNSFRKVKLLKVYKDGMKGEIINE